MNFAEETFTSNVHASSWFIDTIADSIGDLKGKQVVEIGCGTGILIAQLSDRLHPLRGLGADISARNIELARANFAAQPNLDFTCTDFRLDSLGAFDLVVADSVFHLIPFDDRQLAKRMAAEVRSEGWLIFTMPDASLLNRARIALRMAFRLLPPRWIDSLAFVMARRLHPQWRENQLRDRLNYLRLIPQRLATRSFMQLLIDQGLQLHCVRSRPDGSSLNLDHKLFMFRKI